MVKTPKSMRRRDFFKSTTAATAGLWLVKPETAFGASANSALQLGIIGCGGRGTNVAENFVEHTNTRVTALADLFADRLEAGRKHFDTLQGQKGQAKISKTFRGPRAFQELASSDVDVVLVSSPPYFHPEHLEAAVAAKKHVYLEKPVSTDVRGCKKVAELGKKADGKLSAVVGFQIRSGPHFVELTRRLYAGAIGDYSMTDPGRFQMRQRSRRAFLQETAAWTAAGGWVARMPVVSGAVPRFDPSFGTASEALRALRAGVISSRELVEHTFNRIRQHNPRVNAFVTVLEEQAVERARQADDALARGKPWGPLHGLPIVIKDSFETEGVRTTVGSRMFENYVPPRDAVAVARLRRAGAILMGKTNLPEFASDLQCYNAVAGTTNNPWDLTRTPGGSSGGGAAALAAGFTFLELGSDIGGSIRTPCHFCGIYGHKPSLEVVPLQGHIPPLPGTPNPLTDLPVAGPMARSAQDLLLGLKVLGGPMRAEAIAYRWQLPSPRGARLKDYRIGYVLDDAFCPVPPEVKDVLGAAIAAIRKAGVEVRVCKEITCTLCCGSPDRLTRRERRAYPLR